MKKIRIVSLFSALCLILSLLAPAAHALDDPPLRSAKAVVLADLDSGRVLYELNKDEQRAPASLTKVMTVLLAIEALERGEADLDEMVTAQADCLAGLNTDSSTSGIQPGEIISYRDLLYCALVHSANEACNILAHRVSGSVENFVAAMNVRAAELGCVSTHFADPNGLSNEDHYTTAYEMYLITAEALKHELFAEICNTKGYDMMATNLSPARSFYNSNALITADSEYGSGYVYPYAAGVKTGFTQKAGYCLISTAEKDGLRLLAVVMGCDGWLNAGIDEYQNFLDSRSLYEWAFNGFAYREAVSSLSTVARVQVALSADGDAPVSLRPQNDVTLLLPKDLEDGDITLEPTVYDELLTAPIEAGTVLGRAEIMIGGVSYGRVDLVNATAVELSKKEFMSQRVETTLHSPWIILLIALVAVLAIGYLTLVIRYRVQRRKYLRRKRELAARRAARESARDIPLPEESTRRLNAFVDEEMQKKNRSENR